MAKTSERQTDNEAREVGLVIGTVGPVDDGNEDALAAQVELLTQAVVSARQSLNRIVRTLDDMATALQRIAEAIREHEGGDG